MAKKQSEFIKNLKLTAPNSMEYFVSIKNSKERHKYISRIERIVRSSLEYKDYINFLKENVGLDSCIFFNHIGGNKTKRGRVSIEMHHEPFTLYDIVDVVLTKFQDEGMPLNDLDIADEVMKLHYENKVGLVPLSKTAHQIIHNSSKLMVPLNMVYGQYSDFLEEYDSYIDEESPLYDKLKKKMDMTKNLTKDSFDAIKKEFTYLEVEGVKDLEKMKLENETNIA